MPRLLRAVLFCWAAISPVLPFAAPSQARTPHTTISQLDSCFRNRKSDRLSVYLTGQIIYQYGRTMVFRDSSGVIALQSLRSIAISWRAGDVVRILVGIRLSKPRGIDLQVYVKRVKVLRHEAPPPLPNISPGDIDGGAYNFQAVSICGIVTEAIPDEIDPRFQMLSLEKDKCRTLVMLHAPDITHDTINSLIGARVSLVGICHPRHTVNRIIPYPFITTDISRLHVETPPPQDPFDAAEFTPHDLQLYPDPKTAVRQQITGLVIATWEGRFLFLRTKDDLRIEIRLKPGTPVPSPGEWITAAGQVRYDSFFATMYNAAIRPAQSHVMPADEPVATSARQILFDDKGKPKINTRLNGRLVEIDGTVFDTYSKGPTQSYVDVRTDNVHVNVLTGSVVDDPPAIGSKVHVVGICRINVALEDTSFRLTRLSGFSVIPRHKADLTVTARPPWWTLGRLLAVVLALAVLLSAILVWNILLHRLAERQGRRLFSEQVAHLSAELRVDERSRLSVELHDSISQNLTATSFQIDTAMRLIDRCRDSTLRHLRIAAKTILSCREELRNCIWDLRSQTLEDPDMESAIRKTLSQHIGNALLSVRFAVPRERLSDHTAHAILSIVRELTANAVRHGGATRIRIAGAIEDNQLKFSVTDNGCGFAAGACPGVAEGHYGLQGIRERIRRLLGSMSVESEPGKGTRVSMAIVISTAKQEATSDGHDQGSRR